MSSSGRDCRALVVVGFPFGGEIALGGDGDERPVPFDRRFAGECHVVQLARERIDQFVGDLRGVLEGDADGHLEGIRIEDGRCSGFVFDSGLVGEFGELIPLADLDRVVCMLPVEEAERLLEQGFGVQQPLGLARVRRERFADPLVVFGGDDDRLGDGGDHLVVFAALVLDAAVGLANVTVVLEFEIAGDDDDRHRELIVAGRVDVGLLRDRLGVDPKPSASRHVPIGFVGLSLLLEIPRHNCHRVRSGRGREIVEEGVERRLAGVAGGPFVSRADGVSCQCDGHRRADAAEEGTAGTLWHTIRISSQQYK